MSAFQLIGREVPDDRFAKEVEVLVPVELDLDTIRDLNPEFLGVEPPDPVSSLSSRISCAGLNFNSNRSFDRSFIRTVSFMRLS